MCLDTDLVHLVHVRSDTEVRAQCHTRVKDRDINVIIIIAYFQLFWKSISVLDTACTPLLQ